MLLQIADIHAAINELDAEWLDYQLDLEAWFITKPQLRNLNDPVIKAYRATRRTNEIDDAHAAAIGRAYYSAVHAVLSQQAEKEAT